MPTAITLASVDFSTTALVKGLPAISGLDTWAYFGGSLAASQNVGPSGAFTNHSSGPPTYTANYIHCQNGVGAIQTASSFHAAETALIACRQIPQGSPVGGQVVIVGNWYNGYLGYNPFTGGATGVQMFNGNTINLSLVTPPITDWRFFAFTTGGNTTPMDYDLTKNLSATGSGPSTNTTGSMLKTLGTGNAAAGSNNGTVDIAFFASYTTILTKPQIDQVYASARQSLLLRGITV